MNAPQYAGYGFNNVRTLEDFGACHPELVPHKPYNPVADTSWAQQPVAALALIDISRDWHEDLQLCLDLLRCACGILGQAGCAEQQTLFVRRRRLAMIKHACAYWSLSVMLL